MQTTGRLFDDLARVANGAAGAVSGVKDEIEQLVKSRLERVLADMDLVTREEFDAVKAMATKARMEQETLSKRVEILEKRLSESTQKPARKTARKSLGEKTPDSDSTN